MTSEKFIEECKKQGIDPANIAPSAGGTLRNGVSQDEELEKGKETKEVVAEVKEEPKPVVTKPKKGKGK
jgi:hypothetical protein